MDRAALGDIHQTPPLGVVEVAGQLDFTIYLIDHSLGGLAVNTVLCVNAWR